MGRSQRRPAQLAVYLGGAAAFAPIHHLSLASQGRRDIGQRCEVTAGADRAFFGDQWQHVMLKERLHALEQLDAYPRHAVRQRTQAGGQDRARGFRVEQLAQAAAVKGEQMLRQGLDLVQRYRHHTGIAIAGGHAVDHTFAVEQGVEKLCTAGDPFAERRVGLQPGGRTALGHGQQVLDAQVVFAKDHGLSVVHGCPRKGRS